MTLETTPVIGGFYPDPTVCRDDDGVYWLATSSFEYAPGVPIFRSTDAIHWHQVGNALTTDAQFRAGGTPASGGIYAPTLRWHQGRFWLITSDIRSGQEGHFLITTDDPAAGWSAPVHFDGLPGIDPDLAWDQDGRCYLTYCSSASGLARIIQAQVDPVTGEVLETPRTMWSGTGLKHPEAPHLYRHDGWWYLLIAEGGTERGHAVSIARSEQITGPFTGAPGNPIFSHRSTDHPVQNTGHADLLQLTDGSWAVVYLGVRPAGRTPSFHVNGRETFLAGVDWVEGWPVFDPQRFRADLAPRSFTDDFTGPQLHPRWVSPGPRPDELVEPHPEGGIQLSAVTAENGSPGLLATRITDPRWSFEADVDVTAGPVGLVLRLDDRHWCEIRLIDRKAAAVLRIGPLTAPVGRTAEVATDVLTLRIRSVDPTQGGPDDLELSVSSVDAEETVLARFDGRYLSTEVAGGFTGRVAGVRALRTTARALAIRYHAY